MPIIPGSCFTALDKLMRPVGRPSFLALWFLLCALPTGLGCALLTPVGMFSDEPAQAARADGLLHGEIFGTPPPPGFPLHGMPAGTMIDDGMFLVLASREFFDALPDKPVPAADRAAAQALPWLPGMTFFPTQMVLYFPVMYVPGALGLLAGKTFGLTPLHTFYLGRLFMLLAYLLMGAAAIGLARFGNSLIFAVLTLPSAVNLASSYSQDGLIICACALAAGMLTRCHGRLGPSWFTALAALTAAILAKTPYMALLGFCLPPLLAPSAWRAAPGLPRRAGLVLLACALPGGWLLHSILSHSFADFLHYSCPAYHPGPLWPGPRGIWVHDVRTARNLKVLLAHPLEIIWLPLSSAAKGWRETGRHMLGVISWNDVPIWTWEYPCLLPALGAAMAGAAAARPGWARGLDAGFGALALFCAFIGMELSLYITFTRAGMARIDGVQARYFLPLLPFFIFLLPFCGRLLARLPGAAKCPAIAPGWFALPAVTMALVNAAALPWFIFHLYRMPGP